MPGGGGPDKADAQPCSLANAFIEPIATRGDLIKSAYAAVAQELFDLDMNYPRGLARAHLARGCDDRYAALISRKASIECQGSKRLVADVGERMDLPALATWAAGRILE